MDIMQSSSGRVRKKRSNCEARHCPESWLRYLRSRAQTEAREKAMCAHDAIQHQANPTIEV
jgi:hypothetical protein